MKIQALVVSDDPVYLSWLRNAAPGPEFSLVREQDAEGLLARVFGGSRPDLVFFQFDKANVAARSAMVERLLERMPDMPVAGIGDDDDPAIVLSAMRSGARDFLVLKRDEGSVATLMSRLLRRSSQAAPARKQGRVLAVIGAFPSEDIAFLAEHVALAAAERQGPGERALLLDMASPHGAGAIFLNLNHSYGVLDAFQDVHRFDATLIETTFAKHRSGVHVLSFPEDLREPPRLDEEELHKLLDVARGHFACTVVAIDGQMPLAPIRAVVSQADRSLVLVQQSILGSRHTKHLLRALRAEDCPMDRMGLVVDNYRRRVGLEPENLAELFELPLLGTLSTQPGARLQAMNSGEPMFSSAPKDEYCEGVRTLTAVALGAEAVRTPSQGGFLGKLFSGARS